jgi:hypothetical protein
MLPNIVSDGHALAGALANFFGGEKGVEYTVHIRSRNSRPGIADADLHKILAAFCSDRDPAFSGSVPCVLGLGDCLGGIDDHIQNNLVDLIDNTVDRREIRL